MEDNTRFKHKCLALEAQVGAELAIEGRKDLTVTELLLLSISRSLIVLIHQD